MRKSWALVLCVGLIALAIGGYILFISYMRGNQNSRAQWPTTEGTVLSFSSKRDVEENHKWFSIKFSYQVGEKQYSSKQEGIADIYTASRIHNYFIGETVTVYYYPNNPSTAVVEPGLHSTGAHIVFEFIFYGGIAAIVGGVVIFWLNRKNDW